MDFSDIFNSDGSGGLPDWVTEGAAIYGQIFGSDDDTQGAPQTAGPLPSPAAAVASFGGSALWIVVGLVVVALAFGVKGRG